MRAMMLQGAELLQDINMYRMWVESADENMD